MKTHNIVAVSIVGSIIAYGLAICWRMSAPVEEAPVVYQEVVVQKPAPVVSHEIERREWILASLIGYTIWLEARSETEVGRRAVATVIWNRAGGDPRRFAEVILKYRQFSCWNNRRPCIPAAHIQQNGRYQLCLAVGYEMLHGTFRPLADWDHFYNPHKASPAWRKDLDDRTKIGRHVFGVIGRSSDQ